MSTFTWLLPHPPQQLKVHHWHNFGAYVIFLICFGLHRGLWGIPSSHLLDKGCSVRSHILAGEGDVGDIFGAYACFCDLFWLTQRALRHPHLPSARRGLLCSQPRPSSWSLTFLDIFGAYVSFCALFWLTMGALLQPHQTSARQVLRTQFCRGLAP